MKKFNQLLFLSSLLLILSTAQADLVLSKSSFITQSHPAIVGGNQSGSRFGFALSSSNNVLYISSIRYTHTNDINSGAVHKLVGTVAAPLGSHPHNKLIHQGHINADIPGPDSFGHAITTAKAQGNNEAQLIIGVLNKTVDGVEEAGLIHYIQNICDDCEGTVLTSKSFHQNTVGIIGGAEMGDHFSKELVTGDFNGDGYQDVAIGIPNESVGSINDAGAVQIIMANGPVGLAVDNNQFWSGNSTSLIGASSSNSFFGTSLASGDFNGDGVDDLAIGIQGDDVDGTQNAGSVQVLYGVAVSGVGLHDNGLSAVGNQKWSQNSPGIGGNAELSDLFGNSLAAGDFNGDGVDDLAIGIPFENIGNVADAGAVNIIYGSLGVGLTAANDLFISQGEAGFVGASEAQDFFGVTLAVGDLNNDGFDDLVIGASGEDINTTVDTGGVYVVSGSNSGLQFSDEYIITEGILGDTLGLREFMKFGSSMTIDDFDGDGLDDLAIATTAVPPTGQPSVSVIYQQIHQNIFNNGFED